MFTISLVKGAHCLLMNGHIRQKDVYETYMDVETMQPLKFVRNVNEGGYKKYENVNFNKSANTAITNEGVLKFLPVCMM